MITCTCRVHTDSRLDLSCTGKATHRLEDEDGVAYLCREHAAAIKDMYEPGQIRKLPATLTKGNAR